MRETNVEATKKPSKHRLNRILIVWITFLFIAATTLQAQRPNYYIVAELNPTKHNLAGTVNIKYYNHSGIPLDKIGIHLWANAFSSPNSAFAKQMLNMGNLDFRNAFPEGRGGYDSLDFVSNNHPVRFQQDEKHVDIGWLIMDQPLEPGDSIHVSIPFVLRVPNDFSRLGRHGSRYQMTQWYPHIAVFDEKGWHTMPYLEYGEYFNDFADYEVILTVPSSYTIAATGTLSSKEELEKKTVWTFSAQNVIDFAWFASPNFRHEKYLVDVGGEQPVELNIYGSKGDSLVWKRASEYAQRALQFYSSWLGPYPYPQMSVVSTPMSTGGGMEYPMIAQISPAAQDVVIAHEIGHTWLYGILANDERTHPWLDEGFNSFIEMQYMRAFKPFHEDLEIPGAFMTPTSMKGLDALQHSARFNHSLQPPATDPEYQKGDQYYFSAYELPAQGLDMIKSMYGEEMMKMMFRKYYQEHQFSHVTPDDAQSSFEKVCECDLQWYFKDWIHQAHKVDYRIEKLDVGKKEVTIVNHGESQIPLRISTYRNGHRIQDEWIDGFDEISILHMDDRFSEVRLYDQFMSVNRERTANVRPYKFLPKVGILPKVESYDGPTLSVTPVFGYNLTDGFMPGVAFTSGLFPQQHFKFFIAPMYGLESKKIRGTATLRYINDLKGPFDKLLLSFGVDHFGYNVDTHYLFRDHFLKWEPMLALRFAQSPQNAHLTQWLKYRFTKVEQFYGRGIDWETETYTNVSRNYGIHDLSWQMRSDYILRPFEAIANIQAGQGFVRLNLKYEQQFTGKTKHLGTWVKGFVGWLPVYDQPEAEVQFTFTGQPSYGHNSTDYMFDQWLGGRNASTGLFARQIYERDAHLKTLSTVGFGEKWMIGAGIRQAFPFRFLHFYMDAAVFPSAVTAETTFSYSGGAAIVLLKDVFEINIPVLESKDIRESLTYDTRDMWFERISFTANIKLGNPLDLLDRTQLGF